MTDQSPKYPTTLRLLPYLINLSLIVLSGSMVIVQAQSLPGGSTTSHPSGQVRKPSPTPPPLSDNEIREGRELLGALGYWVKLDVSGLDVSLRHALIAFQKVESRPRTGVLTEEEIAAMRIAHRPKPLESGSAHIEIDLCRQVLFIVDSCGEILRILPVSTGSGQCFTEGGRTRRAITPTGRFTIKRKFAGWRKSPLGLLYYPNYIFGGVAIHGNPSVPSDPASHGCIRIPMFAAKEFFEMATLGMVVIVYNSAKLPLPESSLHRSQN
ncbi:MAG: L,D-transpeptidase family protein [Acidobacteria bacterium]|nr:L,D-transpeptidase family protein [Acidobacteriota bacterium]